VRRCLSDYSACFSSLVGANLIETFSDVLGLKTFPAVSARGSPSAPTISICAFQPLLINDVRISSETGFTPYKNGNLYTVVLPFSSAN
jgi:hypothetical protein